MSDALWYYAEQQQQKGPLAASEIAALFRKRVIAADSLVWREGMAGWEPLAQHMAALGLDPRELDSGHLLPPVMPIRAEPAPQVLADVVYAGFWRRFAALFIDRLIILLAIAIVCGGLLLFVAQARAQSPAADMAGAAVQLVFWLAYLVVAPFYFAIQESSRHQATLGKRAVGIKVATIDGNRLGFGQALARWLAASLSYMTLYVGFIMAGFTERKQALHDLIAGTVVVDRWAYSAQPEKQQRQASGCLIAGIVVVACFIPMLGILAAISIPAYQDYTHRAKVAEALMSASEAKLATQEFIANNDRCPRDMVELDLASSGHRYVRELSVAGNDGRCSVQIELTGIEDAYALEGKRIWLELQDNGQWQCSSDAPSRYLPASCR